MARDYEFGPGLTPEQVYAPSPFRRGSYYGEDRGGSLASFEPMTPIESEPKSVAQVTIEAQAEPTGLRAGQILRNMREAGDSQAQPATEGFQVARNASDVFVEDAEGVNRAKGQAAATAMAGTNQAVMDTRQNYYDLLDWMSTETRNIQAGNEAKADSRRRGGGGVLGAIGTIAGSIIGGPIGAGIGAVSGLFG